MTLGSVSETTRAISFYSLPFFDSAYWANVGNLAWSLNGSLQPTEFARTEHAPHKSCAQGLSSSTSHKSRSEMRDNLGEPSSCSTRATESCRTTTRFIETEKKSVRETDTMMQTDTMAHESRKVFFDIFAKHVNMGRNNKPFTQLRSHDGES